MATYAYTFTSGDTVTPTKLNNARTVSAIQTADISDAQITEAKLAANSVSLAKLVTAVQQALLPAGAVQAFAMNSAPSGWLAADGTAVSRSTYASLFSAIGTTYGAGDGSTTFALPDLRGIFVRGSGSQTISGITYNKTFAAKEGDALQGHYHEFNYSSGIRGTSAPSSNIDLINAAPTGTLSDRVGALITNGTNGTPRTASETRPANIALLYCIKF